MRPILEQKHDLSGKKTVIISMVDDARTSMNVVMRILKLGSQKCSCSMFISSDQIVQPGSVHHYVTRIFPVARISQHHWFSGKISACQAGASGSISDVRTHSDDINESPG